MNEEIVNNVNLMLTKMQDTGWPGIINYMDGKVWEKNIKPDDNGFIKQGFILDFYYNSLTGRIEGFFYAKNSINYASGRMKINYSREARDGITGRDGSFFNHRIEKISLNDEENTFDFARKNLEESVRLFNMVMENNGGKQKWYTTK